MPVHTLRRNDGTIVCERCTVAESPLTRLRGLLGRDGLEPGEGLLLRPASAVHTYFMRFPIDVVFLDRALVVLGSRTVSIRGGRPRSAARKPCSSCRRARARGAGSPSATS